MSAALDKNLKLDYEKGVRDDKIEELEGEVRKWKDNFDKIKIS